MKDILKRSIIERKRDRYRLPILGDCAFMKAELQLLFDVQFHRVQSYDGTLLDCCFIRTGPLSKTVLYCNPNACYYEYLHYEV